jgi:acyl-homoserine lactone acylase PvdQ
VGKNKHLSWSFTQSARSGEELYVDETPASEDAAGATSVGLVQHEETLRVRGEEDVTFTVESSPLGPVISKLLSPVVVGNIETAKFDWSKLVLKSDALSHRMSFSFLHEINTARNVTAFAAAVEKASAASLDFVFASADGSIGSVTTGKR